MNKFTFITEFQKGTYIQQVSAIDLESSIKEWVDIIDQFNIPGIGGVEKSKIKKELLYEKPTKIKGVENVWCLFFKLRKSSVLVNIVGTL
ncbi:MAG: hypothetical protein U0V04_17915 [Spirosomataceae bacterium]|jgi:hypothetical protein